MKFIRSHLQYFLAIVVVLSISVPALVTGIVVTQSNYERSVEFESRIAAQNYLDVLVGGLALAVWNLAPELAKPIVDSVRLDPSILAITATYKSGEVFLDYHRAPVEIIEREENQIVMQAPIQFRGQEIGHLVLNYSLNESLSTAKSEAQTFAKMLIFQLLITFVVLSFVLNRRVLKPLVKLKEAAQGIASGDLKTQIPSVNDDEFGALSNQLEAMRGALEKHVTLLELRVGQRTRDLEKLNVALSESMIEVQTAQKELVQQEKLAALGGLVAGIAHELNTPVGNALMVSTSLISSTDDITELMKKGMTRSALDGYIQSVAEGASMIEHNLTRAAELVAAFKQTAIDQTTAKRREFDLRKLVSETLVSLSPNLRNKAITVNNLIPEDCLMDSYPGPISQIITNLINNAILHGFESIDSGTITLKAELFTQTEKRWVSLVIGDSGKGIPKDIQKKIFDPFFTTKLGKGGNGLGMHIVHNLVTGALGGEITLHSVVGEGTEFTITIPCTVLV